MRMCESLVNKSVLCLRRLSAVAKLTFLNHPNDSAGGLASARHFNVTFSRSARIITRLGIGSSLAKCTDTMGASETR